MSRPARLRRAARDPEGPIFSGQFALLLGTGFAFFVSWYLPLATLPLYVLSLGGRETEIGLLMGFFSFTALVSRPWAGRSVDEFGSRVVILVGTVIFVASALLYGVAVTVLLVLGVRLLHGLGMSAFGTGGATLAAELAPANRRAEVMGYYGLAANIPMAIGPALGLQILDRAGHASVFLAAAAAGLVAVAFGLLNYLGYRHRRVPRVGKPPLVCHEALPTAVVMASVTLPYGVIVSFVPVLAFQRAIPSVGLYFAVYAAALIISRLVTGRIADRFGRGAVIVPALALTTLSTWIIGGADSLPELLISGLVYGFSFGAAQPALLALTIDVVPAQGRGVAMGTFSGAWELGIMLGGLVAGPLLALGGFDLLFAVAALVPLFGLAYFLIWLRGNRSAHPVTPKP